MSTTRKKKVVRRKKKKKTSIFDKLTDSSKYTGAHKHRFNDDGSGRGLDGRDSVAKGSGSDRGAPWSSGSSMSSGGMSSPPKNKTSPTTPKKKKVVRKKKKVGVGSPGGAKKKKVVRKKKKKQSIFDKLTDSSKYTGSHKNRFNTDGTGRGKAGRDLGATGRGSNRGNPW